MPSPNRTDQVEPTYVSPSEAANLTGLSQKTLARLADRGEIDAYELPSGHRRYRRTSLEDLTRPRRMTPRGAA